ncbi:MAG: M28 family peptidase [bacterium]
MKQISNYVLAFLLLFIYRPIFSQIDSVLSEISPDSLIFTVKELTGALPVTLNGKTDTIKTRAVLTTGNRIASEYIYNRMETMGLETERQHFHGNYDKIALNFTGLTATNKNEFPLWLCSDWGEIFSCDDTSFIWKSRLKSATRQVDRLDWISTFGKDTIISMGRNGDFAYSFDGGELWNRFKTTLDTAVCFITPSPQVTIAAHIGGSIWRSNNFGSSWTEIIVDNNFVVQNGVALGRNTIILIGNNQTKTGTGMMFRSEDAGLTWQEIQINFTNPLFSIFSFDSFLIWAASSAGEVYFSYDAGINWLRISSENQFSDQQKIYFISQNEGWVTDSENKIFHTIDGGINWELISTLSEPFIISDFVFLDLSNGIVIGKEYSAIRTYDGGTTWNDRTIPLLQNILATKVGTAKQDKYILLTAHSDCDIYHHSPGENTWLCAPGAEDDGSGVAMLIELARVFSKYPIPLTLKFATFPDEEWFLRGSEVLAQKLFNQQDSLMLFIDFDMVGYDSLWPGTILLCTDKKESWGIYYHLDDLVISTNIPLKIVLDTKHFGCANARGFTGKGIPIFCFSEGTGVHEDPNYHRPTDTWDTLNPEFMVNIAKSAAILLDDIAKNGIVDIEENNPNQIPLSFFLSQAYPNPFNPTTTIEYMLPEAGNVRVEVFNLLGELVKTPVSEYKSAGRYNLVFDAGDLPSGVYFYTLRVNDFFDCRKTVLLR